MGQQYILSLGIITEIYLSEIYGLSKKMRKINEVWKGKEGSKVVWKLQAPNGILTFKTKKQAIAWQNASK